MDLVGSLHYVVAYVNKWSAIYLFKKSILIKPNHLTINYSQNSQEGESLEEQ